MDNIQASVKRSAKPTYKRKQPLGCCLSKPTTLKIYMRKTLNKSKIYKQQKGSA